MHLLRFSDNLKDDISVARANGVNGIDSAVPIRLGLAGEIIHHTLPSHAPRGDYWETAKEATPEALANLERIRRWIDPAYKPGSSRWS